MKKLLLSLVFIFFSLLGANSLFAQNCSFTFLNNDSGCIPIPILAYANDTAVVPAVTSRNWTLTNCSNGAVVFSTQPGLNPNFSFIPSVAGCYNLTMTSNSSGGTCTFSKNGILIADTPNINIISISPTSFCAPKTVTVNMNNSSSCGFIDLTRVQWGCGNISIDSSNPASVTHVYSGNCFPTCYDVVVVARSTCGCFSTKRARNAVCIQQPPRANFSVDVSSGVCVSSLTSRFTADSTGPGFTYTWFVNNQQLQTGPSRLFTHTFPAALSCYNIKLVVSNTFGCSDSLNRDNFICVFAAPQLAFKQDTSSKCVDSGQTALLCLRDISQPFLPNPQWRVSGGTPYVSLGPFTGDSVCVPVTNIGCYTVTLIGRYGPNCVDSVVVPNSFCLKANPSVCFYADSTGTCQQNLTTTFRNCSTAPPGSSYFWNFGAGAIPANSNQAIPSTQVQYLGLGNRDVSLAVTSTNGCFKLRKAINYIAVDTVRPLLYVAGDLYGCGPLEVSPQSITFIPPGVNYSIRGYTIEIWKDSTSTLIDRKFGSAFTETYSAPGCYDVKMTITTTNGCSSSTWLDKAFCIGTEQTCRVVATDTVMCFEEDSVSFRVEGPCKFNRLIVHYGDETDPNATSFIEGGVTSFSHTYQSFGGFDAIIIPVLDSCEGDTMKVHVTIKPPAASFTSATNCNTGDLVCFTNTTVGANRYHWNFSCAPDTFNTFSPCIILPRCDTCRVSLTAFNDTTGCVHTKTQNIQTACAGVTASFSPDSASGCGTSQLIRFTNTTPGASAGTTVWKWSDGTTQSGPVVRENFYTGVWNTEMIYTAPGGCVDTAYGKVIRCDFNVDFGPTSLCLPDSFHFRSSAFDTVARNVGCDSIVSWYWDFGGGVTSTEPNPVHYFPLGSHPVKLRVTNLYGCEDSITKTVTAGTPVYSFWSVDSNICPGSTVCITNNTSSGVSLTEQWTFQGSNIPSFTGHSPPCLTYNTSGDFLLVYSVAGGTCRKSDTVMMHVHEPILSAYLSRNYASCPNPPVGVCGINTSQYVDSTTDVYTWDFGNREYLEVNPCDIYPQAGIYPVTLTVVTNNGCRDTLIVDTVVIDGPSGTISHSPRGICACKDTVDFMVSTIKATQLTFVYGCNQGFEVINPIFPVGTDLAPRTYDFHIPYCIADSCLPQLTLGDQTGCLVLINDSFVYIDSPVIDIAFNNYGICVSGTVDFRDSTRFTLPDYISYNVDWSWDFGDPNDPGIVRGVPNPSHYYSQSGEFPLTFTIVSNFGCRDTFTSNKVVLIPKIPIVGFYADDTLICAETSTCFHDTSYVDTITAAEFWYWDFGDGTTDSTSGPNPCHTYMTGGYYTVHLCVFDSIGCVDCDSGFVIRVIPKPIAVAGPNAAFCYGVPTQLSGSGSNTCQWSPPGLVTNPAICNPFTTIYQDTSFVLTVTDNFGCFGVDTLRATVARVFANFGLVTNACLQDTVCVTDSSSSINGTLAGWQYNFGNGDSLPGANVCYRYPNPGTYNVTETVIDNNGCIDTAVRTIIVFPQPQAAFSLNDTIICSDQLLCFTDLSTSITAVQSWEWNFGFNQGGFSGATPPCHLFTAPYQANYDVQLAVTDQNQCKDTAHIIVTVNEVPKALFSWTTSCEDSPMPLTSTSVRGDGAIDSCMWVLWLGAPNPVVSTDCNTSFTFAPGPHDVQLVVHDLNGCQDTIVQTVLTDSLSQLFVFPGDTTVCLGSSVDYTVTGVFDNVTWTPSTWISDPNSSVVTINPLGNVGYIISAVNGVCDAASDTFSIQVVQPVEIEVSATPDQIVLGLSSNITTQIGGKVDSLVWSPDETLDCRTCPNPVATPTQTTTYCVSAYYGKNGIICSTPACVTITVLNNCNQSIIYVPNTFTPNGDGINDIFMIRGLAATRINNFRIFDRWGKLVFESLNGTANEPRFGWDGTDRGGEKLNPAVFVYTYEIECINHDIITGSGNITLVR